MIEKSVIAGAGICCQDYILFAPPVKLGTTTTVSNYIAQGGGLIGTALVACARLGAQCRLYTLLGLDNIGDEILKELQNEGVSTSGAVRIQCGTSPFSFIYVNESTGDRTIFYHPAKNLEWDNSQDLSGIESANALVIDDIYLNLSIAAARKARAAGVPVIADLIPNDRNRQLLLDVDILIAPKHYIQELGLEHDIGAVLKLIHELGPTTAVITLGEDGYVFSDSQGKGQGAAFQVDAVDTTGAGDAFHGAFAFGIARKWDTQKCCEFASAVAAIKCTQPGGRTGLPTLQQVNEFLQNRNRNWRLF